MSANFEKVEGERFDDEREERWIRRIDPKCWISALYRRTGFGWFEWETAIVICHDLPEGQKPTWKDRDCLIIAGDRREQLNDMPRERLKPWFEANIDGNRNSMETIIHAVREANA